MVALNIGETIIVKAWKNFKEFEMTCINVSNSKFGIKYEFNNGMTLFDIELEYNLELWNSRGGYEIVK